MRMSISSKGSLVQKCESGEFDSHTTTNIINMKEIKENSVKLLTNEVLTKQLLKLYKNRIKL